MPTVSVRCITNGPLARTAAILAQYRPVADEIICFVNGLFTQLELQVLLPVCDEVVPVEMTATFTGGRYRPWMIGYGRQHDWVNLIDHDEVPSCDLLESFRALASIEHVANFAGPRRWLYPNSSTWLHLTPWEPNFKMFLTRTTPTTLLLRSPIHADMPVTRPYRFVDLPTYHLVLLTETAAERHLKVSHYEQLGAAGGIVIPAGHTDREYYLPGPPSAATLSPVPAVDREAIESVLSARSAPDRVIPRTALATSPRDWLPGTIPWVEVARHWPGRDIATSATSAIVSLWGPSQMSPPVLLTPGARVTIWVRVVNTSSEIWPREGWDPVIRLGAYWRRQGVIENICESRAGLGAAIGPGEVAIEPLALATPVIPGNYELVIDMVAELVTWFGCGITLVVTVEAP